MKIYVASSWRNKFQPQVVALLRGLGHEVYDFKNPPQRTGFSWSQVDEKWQEWDCDQYCEGLRHPVAQAGFDGDLAGMRWADCCVLVLPSGRSAHTEAGYFAGAGKPVIVFLTERQEAELMYKLFSCVFTSHAELKQYFHDPGKVIAP